MAAPGLVDQSGGPMSSVRTRRRRTDWQRMSQPRQREGGHAKSGTGSPHRDCLADQQISLDESIGVGARLYWIRPSEARSTLDQHIPRRQPCSSKRCRRLGPSAVVRGADRPARASGTAHIASASNLVPPPAVRAAAPQRRLRFRVPAGHRRSQARARANRRQLQSAAAALEQSPTQATLPRSIVRRNRGRLRDGSRRSRRRRRVRSPASGTIQNGREPLPSPPISPGQGGRGREVDAVAARRM